MDCFKIEEQNGLLLVTLPPVVDGDVSNVEAETKSWMVSSARLHVLDFAAVAMLATNAYRPFVLYNQALKGAGKWLFCLNLQAALKRQIRQDGLASVFVVASTLAEAKSRSLERPRLR